MILIINPIKVSFESKLKSPSSQIVRQIPIIALERQKFNLVSVSGSWGPLVLVVHFFWFFDYISKFCVWYRDALGRSTVLETWMVWPAEGVLQREKNAYLTVVPASCSTSLLQPGLCKTAFFLSGLYMYIISMDLCFDDFICSLNSILLISVLAWLHLLLLWIFPLTPVSGAFIHPRY